MVNARRVSTIIFALAAIIGGFLITTAIVMGGDDGGSVKPVPKEFDVAEDGTRFVFDEAPVHPDGMPAYGNAFVTQGYIYPAGTLNDSNGVLPSGEPEFPDLVIGEWTCRGWFIGDGAHTETGPWVITTQYYDFGGEAGRVSLVSDGVEVADLNTRVNRAVTGGTGKFRKARGEVSQELLGFNESEGVNLTFTLR